MSKLDLTTKYATSIYISREFQFSDFVTKSYRELADFIRGLPRYKKMPSDAIDEIVELCNRTEKVEGKNKLDVVLAYFEHALSCRVVERFPLTNKQKQLLFTAVYFLDEFLKDAQYKHKDVSKLFDLLSRISTRHHTDMEQQLEYAFKHFTKLTDQKDVLCNHLIMSTTLALFFAKDSDIPSKLKKNIIKLSNKIHDAVEKTDGDTVMYQNAARICSEFYEHVERINNKKS